MTTQHPPDSERRPARPSPLETRLTEEARRLVPSKGLAPGIVAAVRAAAAEERRATATPARPPRAVPIALAAALAAAVVVGLLLGRPPADEAPPPRPDGAPTLAQYDASPARDVPRLPDPPVWLVRTAEELPLLATLAGDPLANEARNLWSDASRAAQGFVEALPKPLRTRIPVQ